MRGISKYLVEYSVFPLVALSVYVWGSALEWKLEDLSALSVFPVLGLVAFTVMWWHFLLGFVKDLSPSFVKIKNLHKTSSILVFFLIILHPLLLAFYGVSNNIDQPPELFFLYVGESNKFYIVLGYLALTIFLLYDLARWLKNKAVVKNNWLIVDSIDDVAFVAIFFHSLMIGSHVQTGWFKYLWIFYGVSGLIFIATKHYLRFRPHETKE